MLVLFRPGRGQLAGPGNVSGGERRSLRGLFFRLSPRRRPALPGRIEVRVSDELFGVFTIEHFSLAKGGKQ